MRFLRLRVLLALWATLLASAATPAIASESDDRTAELEMRIEALQTELSKMRDTLSESADDRIAELERKIEVLAKEIESMKLGEAAVEAHEGEHGLAPAASKVYRTKRGVSIGGYGEMLYENFSSSREDGVSSDKKDQLDFLRAIVYFGYKFNDSILFNSEIEFEHASSGESGEVSVEFAYLDFLIRDGFNVRTGLLLVPVGFVNEMHEPPTFLGARRPAVEQSILPSTWRENGVGVFGDAGPVSYRVYVVTGLNAEGFSSAGVRGGRSSGSKSVAEDFAVVGRLDWKPLEILTLGASAYTGGSSQGLVSRDATVRMLEGHAELRWRGLQARALYAKTSIDDVAALNQALNYVDDESVGEEQYGWYGEVGYDVLSQVEGTRHALIPYVRHERFNTQERVPAGFSANPANDVTVTTAGLAWKPISNVVVKTDWNLIENGARTGVDQVNVAVGYVF